MVYALENLAVAGKITKSAALSFPAGGEFHIALRVQLQNMRKQLAFDRHSNAKNKFSSHNAKK